MSQHLLKIDFQAPLFTFFVLAKDVENSSVFEQVQLVSYLQVMKIIIIGAKDPNLIFSRLVAELVR